MSKLVFFKTRSIICTSCLSLSSWFLTQQLHILDDLASFGPKNCPKLVCLVGHLSISVYNPLKRQIFVDASGQLFSMI